MSDCLPRSKSEARRLRLPYYFTGRPCTKGHVSKRDTSAGCYQCCLERKARKYREQNPLDILAQRIAAKNAGKRKVDIEAQRVKRRARQKAAYRANPKSNPRELQAKRILYATSAEYREFVKKRNRDWHLNNKAKATARVARRRAQKIKATPKWLDNDMKNRMVEFHIEAQRLTTETGIAHEVDHIIPLKGKLICGLHVPWNLQVTKRTPNRMKQNKIPDDPALWRAAA